MVCSIVMTANVRHLLLCCLGLKNIADALQNFMKGGCPNCEAILGLRNSQDAIQECTSQVFEGLITLGDPKTSWVAKWQRLSNYVGGVYAVKVVGQLPREIIEALEDNGIKYIPRDGSSIEDEVAA
jgi:transcription elongation factor SPT4